MACPFDDAVRQDLTRTVYPTIDLSPVRFHSHLRLKPLFAFLRVHSRLPIEVAAKRRHHLTHPPDKFIGAYGLERPRRKVGWPKMKSAIPTAAESVYIGRTEERGDTFIDQLQLLKTLPHNVKTSIP